MIVLILEGIEIKIVLASEICKEFTVIHNPASMGKISRSIKFKQI